MLQFLAARPITASFIEPRPAFGTLDMPIQTITRKANGMSLSKFVIATVTAIFLTAIPPTAASALVPTDWGMQQEAIERSKKKVGPPCNDRVVKWIWTAGFRGQNVRVAWAIAQRESNGQPGESTWPDLGIMQLNAPSWQGSKYWPANIYDPVQSFKAVKKMVRDMNWQPWGLRVKNGKISYDFSSYGMWSSWHHQNWIVIPFERYYAQFPKKCAKNL